MNQVSYLSSLLGVGAWGGERFKKQHGYPLSISYWCTSLFYSPNRRVENSTPLIKCCHCTRCLLQAWDLLRGRALTQSSGTFPRAIAPRGTSLGTEALSYRVLSHSQCFGQRGGSIRNCDFFSILLGSILLRSTGFEFKDCKFNYSGKEGNQKTTLVFNLKTNANTLKVP